MNIVVFPGQGSQYRGMGKDLFPKYTHITNVASDILGYDIVDLCLNDSRRELALTQFTQPALYTVNALNFYEHSLASAEYYIGHSLGEYNALLAADAFDFKTGLQLVKKRGELMAAASGGGMAAVLGISTEQLLNFLKENNFSSIDIANFNTPTQTVISGQESDLKIVITALSNNDIKVVPLYVSAPFHSRYMAPAAREFSLFLKQYQFSNLSTRVISNVTARPYNSVADIPNLLSQQIQSSVQWVDTIRYLKGQEKTIGSLNFYEHQGSILTKMINDINDNCTAIIAGDGQGKEPHVPPDASVSKMNSTVPKRFLATKLGSLAFREAYGLDYSYVAGAMYKGIASKELVVKMGKAKLLSFLGTGGRSLGEIENDIRFIQKHLANDAPYGINLIHNLNNPDKELETVNLYLSLGVRNIEAAAYMQMTAALVLYRVKGLEKDRSGNIVSNNNIMAKVSRPEVAEAFMRPAPERILQGLQDEGLISKEQVEMSKTIPMACDICVEADSGGHTDSRIATTILPSIQSLKKTIANEFSYAQAIRIGLAGGIGTPQAAASAFMMGADFILTGSINQCTLEAGTSPEVKQLLQDIDVQDTDYAPAGDMFEIGARVQVLKKGVLFPARANKLYKLYEQYSSIDDIPAETLKRIEKNTFGCSVDEVWKQTKEHLQLKGKYQDIQRAESETKHKMALIFRWYFAYSNQLALSGKIDERLNFQVHTGPAMGSFNQWVKDKGLHTWKEREVDRIGKMLMNATADYINEFIAEPSL